MQPKEPDNWENDPEHVELIDFLIEKTKGAKSPMSINQLAKEFKEKSGSSQTVPSLIYRIRALREKAAESDRMDRKTKVKLAFALSAPIDTRYLEELQKDADVELDGKNQITKYRAKDGSLELEGDQSRSAKHKESWKQRMREIQEGSDDGSINTTPRTPGSVKRSAAEVPSSSKRTRIGEVKSEDDPTRIPSGESESPKIQGAPGAQEASIPRRRGRPKASGVPVAPDGSEGTSESRARAEDHAPNPGIQFLRQPKMEETPEAPIFRSGGAPRASGAPGPPARPKSEENGASGSNNAYTPQIKFLEAIQFLILNLDMPNLSPLQAKIEKKLRESSPNAKIANDEMILAMELLAAKITNHSVSNLSENVESISLKVFLCFLKAAILNSKLEGLEALLEKIKQKIYEPVSKDKSIPVEKVVSVLQHTMDGI